MYRLLETIRIDDGKPANLGWHEKRLQKSFAWLYRKKPFFNLYDLINVPPDFCTGRVKLRLFYDDKHYKMEFSTYIFQQIKTLKLIHCDDISYALKYADRTSLNQLLLQRSDCDDILIIKQGLITDTSYCNTVFFDGTDWITPSKPLLRGTCRQLLINEKRIKTQELKIQDISRFKYFRLINALRPFDEQEPIGIGNIGV